jgi:hypothetical protein
MSKSDYNLVEVIESVEDFMHECLSQLGKYKTEVSNDLGLSDAQELYVTSLRLMRLMCMNSPFCMKVILPTMRKIYACIVVMLMVSPLL